MVRGTPHATSDSETSARWKRVDGRDSSRSHHSHQVQDNNLGPTQASLSPRSQRLDTLQPPQSRVLTDVVAQLEVLMASVQSIATTVGQLGSQLHSLQTEGNEKCRQRGRRVRRTRWFLLRIWRKRGRSRLKPLASQNSTLPDLRRTEWCGRRSSFESLQTRFRCLQLLCCPSLFRALITNDDHFTGVRENGGAVLRAVLRACCPFFCRQQRFLVQYRPVRFSMCMARFFFYKRKFRCCF